jgi:hypothetical protein
VDADQIVKKAALRIVPPESIGLDDLYDSAKLLDEVRAFVQRFVAFPTPACLNAVTLWIAHAHLVAVGENSPRLALLSPEPGSGKTRTLEVLELLVPSPMFALSASTPATFRSLMKAPRVLLFDEVDAIFGKRGTDDSAEDLRALLNAGHRRGATIPRCVGPAHDVVNFPVFAAAALAGLGDLPDTLMTRSVIIRMRRRLASERVEPFRRRLHEPKGSELSYKLAEWCATVSDQVGMAWPEMPDGVTDRPADVWEPLLAIADAAGGHWPDTGRAACLELVKVGESREASLGVRLLADLRSVFGESDTLSTEAILAGLCSIEESPWADLRGKPLDARGLARRLRQYGIGSVKVKIGDKALQGYRREHLWDSFARYLPPTTQKAEPLEPPEPGTSEQAPEVPDAGRVPEPEKQGEPISGPLTSDVPKVPQVPHSGGSGRTMVPTLDAACPICDHPPPWRGSFGIQRCEHQEAAGLVPA